MNLSDLTRNSYMLQGSLTKRGYVRWWHSFSGTEPETGKTRTFFVEIFVVNPGLGQERPILGWRPRSKRHGPRPSYVMVKAGVFPDESGEGGRQLHTFYPISALEATGTPLVMRLTGDDASPCQKGDCLYSEDRLKGFVYVTQEEARHRSFMADAGYMEWDLTVLKELSCHTGIRGGKLFQSLHLLDSYWHGEGIRSYFKGSVTLDDVIYEVTPELSYGYADKHWGRRFDRHWFQFACGCLESSRSEGQLRHSALALTAFSPRFLCFSLRRRFLVQLTYMDEDFECSRCKWEAKETENRYIWHILAQNKDVVIKISGSCTKWELLQLRYESPDGKRVKSPLQAGSGGIGTLQFYRKTPQGRELRDSLKLKGALCIFRD